MSLIDFFSDPNKPVDELEGEEKYLYEMLEIAAKTGENKIDKEIISLHLLITDEAQKSSLLNVVKLSDEYEIIRPIVIDKERLYKSKPDAEKIINELKGKNSYEQECIVSRYINILEKRIEALNELKVKSEKYEKLLNENYKSKLHRIIVDRECPYAEIPNYIIPAIDQYIVWIERQKRILYSEMEKYIQLTGLKDPNVKNQNASSINKYMRKDYLLNGIRDILIPYIESQESYKIAYYIYKIKDQIGKAIHTTNQDFEKLLILKTGSIKNNYKKSKEENIDQYIVKAIEMKIEELLAKIPTDL